MPGGFRERPIAAESRAWLSGTWNEAGHPATRESLAGKAVRGLGPTPHIKERPWEAIKVKADQPAVYTLDHHTHLLPGSLMRPLFDRLSKEVRALDSCVTEEVRKLYVAFKAETNFVDVVPQKGRLVLSLNMRFPRASTTPRKSLKT